MARPDNLAGDQADGAKRPRPKASADRPKAGARRRAPSKAAEERAREQERQRIRREREDHLKALGLSPGDSVRFRRSDEKRWKPATVERVESDGSLGLRDGKGAARAIPAELVEVRATGPRGGTVWEPLPERIASAEQLRLI